MLNRRRRPAVAAALLALVALVCTQLWTLRASAEDPIVLWHAYRGAEKKALDEILDDWSGPPVETLSLPHDAFATKLSAAIPLGDGPDLFIDAHERLGDYQGRRLVAPVGAALGSAPERDFQPQALAAVRLDGQAYGVPLSQKCVALYYREDLVDQAPETFEALADSLRQPLPEGTFLLAYANAGIYAHAPFLSAFGGRLLTDDDQFGFVGPEAVASVALAKGLVDDKQVPENADGALVTRLFRAGKAAYAISGPWLATDLADSKVPYRVAVLPKIAATGLRMQPLLTVEAVMLSPDGAKRPEAVKLAEHVASRSAGEKRQQVARTVSARRDVVVPEGDELLAVFSEQAHHAVPMPTSVAMRAVWEPAKKAIRKVLNGTMDAPEALAEAKWRFDDVRRPPPPPASPTPALLVVGALCLLGAWQLVRRARQASFRTQLRDSLPAYGYIAHGVIAVGLLVFVPLIAGASISLFAGPSHAQYYVGLANFWEILTARGGPLLASGSFYLVLLVTVTWTVVNVFFHLAIGMFVGVLLSRPTLRLKAVYRVLLIVPWAVPNYVTALAWKGMFHRQFGAVTALTNWLGDVTGAAIEPISWFSQFSTAFTANVATNVWLGFPFMMVVTLAALTGVPKDVLEAAEVDGATRMQRFWRVTLPIIRPTMVPAALLGGIWTFNMFNVVFLVSGGEPDGKTDILVSEAYRWAFTRQAQYGYAAAYAVLIFLLLFVWTKVPGWLDKLRARRAAPLAVAAAAGGEAP
ncbi:MAG: extracellular solute-binding protein [Deltaproteobacteria bacterium]|nr:extracellular solute-binding protein [Deltaproteobacteria bacterium]